MLFNRKGINQKNWRMVKKGKHFLFGCTLFLATGAIGLQQTQVVRADEVASSVVTSMNSAEDGDDRDKGKTPKEEVIKQEDNEINLGVTSPLSKKSDELDKKEDVAKTEVNKQSLIELIEKIKNIDLSKKTIDSVEKLNLSLSRAQQLMESPTVSQEEVDKEEKALKESFEKLEDKPEKEKASESREKAEPQKEEKSDLSKEKITKVTETVNEIHSLANQINYEFSDTEKELVKTAEKLSEDSNREDEVESLLKEVTRLRNKVANRMTRAHSGKRDPRNGQPINGNGESRFRAVYFLPTQNQHGRGEAGLVNETRTDLTYYNSDEIYSFMRVLGQRGPGEPLYKYEYGENRGKEDKSPYYLKTVGVISGLDKLKGITLRVAYKNPRTGKEDFQDITSGVWPVNNPEVKAVIRGWLGRYDKTGEAVEPGDYRVTIAAGRKNPENSITYTFHVKAQSERNTVNDLATPTYVDDVRHLTEKEKTALIKKFEAAHPGVVNRAVHIDYDHAEVSADGATMTIHFKDGFAPKTIQTNAQNDAIAKHQSITALYGDPHDFYKNPRNLVKSKTENELPSTVDVQWKTPFNLQQPGTRNAVVTVNYQNGTVKDVSTPYTVLDFVGKQDKRINQHQSGELGDARSYITLSNGTAPATDLTIRWKGGSTVDTSRPTVHHKQIEILRGNTTMKTVDIPVEIVDNIRPTVEIPYDNPGNQEIYVYSHENNNITLKAKDNNGKVSKVYLAFAADNRQGLGQEDNSYLGGGSPDGLYLTATKIKSETTGSDAQPATITVSGNINNQPFTGEKSITRYLYTEDPAGNANYEHVGHANDNGAPGRIRFVWKPQTFKYTATANSQTQTVSYKDEPSAEASINKTGLPSGTTYAWKTKPDTSSPGNKSGVVEVTYPDTSKDTVNVTVSVRKLSDEYAPTGNKIVRNQNVLVTNNDLKAAVAISNNGNSKVKSVTAGTISTANAGTQTIKATVTYLDNTTDPVDIPLEVKDVTAPTITTPSDIQNWDLIALDRTLPSIKVAATDNTGGTGVKSTTVTGLPDFLVYDNATKTIKFKNGVQEVTKLPVGQDSKTYTATIQVTDNADNPSQRQFTITVKSMTTKYTATPNVQKQTVSYDVKPDAGTSVNKNGLPAGTTYTWATTPSTTTGPGDKAGSVTVTYPDDSKDTVNVTVNVRAQKDEYNPQPKVQTVDNGAVPEAKNSIGNVDSLPPKTTFEWKGGAPNTAVGQPGEVSGTVIVHYPDGTSEEVPVKVNVKGQADTYTPAPKVQTVDNGAVPEAKNSIGNVDSLPPKTTFEWKGGAPNTAVGQPGEVSGTVIVHYPDGTSEEVPVKVNVKGQADTYTPAPKVQTVDNGAVPEAKNSIGNVDSLPPKTTFEWKGGAPNTAVGQPGEVSGTVIVHYPDGTSEEVPVKVNVKGQADTYTPAPKVQTVDNGAVPEAKNSIGNVDSLPPKTTFEWKGGAPNTAVGQPGEVSGTVIVHYPDGTSEEVPVKVNVKGQADTYTPAPKVQTVDNGAVPEAKNSIGNVDSLPPKTTFEWKGGAPNTAVGQPGEVSGTVIVHYPDGTSEEVPVKVNVKGQADTYTPAPKVQTVDNGAVPEAKNSIGNVDSLPPKTTFEWKGGAPNTAVGQPGEVSGTVIVHYPDGTSEEVPVKVNVKGQADTYTPAPKVQTVDNGAVPEAKNSIGNVDSLPPKTTFEWKGGAPNTAVGQPGEVSGTVIVHYPDGTSEEVPVKVNVKGQADTYTPAPKVQTVDNGAVPEAKNSIGNVDSLPPKTTFEWKGGAPNTAVGQPGEVSGTVIVHYPDGTSEEVPVKVNVKGQADTYTPAPKVQTVDNGAVPEAKNSIGNVDSLPPKTTFEWKGGAPNTAVGQPGEVSGTVIVHYPDGTSEEVPVKVNVKGQADTYTPAPKVQTVDNGAVPEAKNSIGNVDSLPPKTTFEWKGGAPNTAVGQPGEVSGTVIVHYPDGTSEEVPVKVNVKGQADTYTPAPKVQTVDNGAVPEAKNSIGNVDSLPPKTTFEWKGGAPNTAVGQPGEVSGTVIVHYPDGTSEEVPVKVNVKGQADTYTPAPKVQTVDNGAVPEAKNSIGNVDSLPPKTTFEWKGGAPNTAVGQPGEVSGTVIVHYPDGTSEEVPVKVNVKGQADTYTPAPKVQTVDNGAVPEAKNSIGNVDSLPPKTTFEWKGGAPNTAVGQPGEVSGTVIVHYPDGTSEEVPVKVNVKGQADTYTPAPKVQTVDNGAVPEAKNSIGNVDSLPPKTTFEWKGGAPNTAVGQPGEVSGTVIVHYPDGTSEEVPVKVNVKGQADTYTPAPKVQTVDNGAVPEAKNSIGNVDSLPPKTTFEWKGGAPNTAVGQPGEVSGTVIVHYPDGTSEEVPVKVNVKGQADTYTPAPKVQTVDNGAVPEAKNSIGNVDSLPPKTTFEWKGGAPNTAVGQPGEVSGTVIVHYPDGTSEEVPVKVNVKGQADTYTPAPKVQTVDNGAVPEAKNSIGNVDSLPPKTTFEWKGGAPNTAVGQPGEVSGTVIVHYPDGTSEEVPVKVNVKGQADTYTPAPKVQTVDNGAVPEAKNSIGNVDSLPPKTTFEWKGGAPNTAVGQPGEVSGTVIVHYPDGTSEEVPVKVNVKGQADTYTPAPKVQTVDNGAVPEAKNSIGNVDSLPPKTTFEWKGGAPNTAVGQPGEVSGTVIVHYPDGTSEEVPVKVNVKGQADTYTPAPKVQTVDNGAVPEAKNSIGNVDSLPPKTTFEWKGGAPNTAVGQPGEVSGTVIVHYPDGTSEEVPVKVNVKGQADTYTPAPKVQTVDNGAVPEAKNSIGNVDSLPPKTTFEWKGGAPNTAVGQPGEVSGTVIVHYPDGTSEEVPVKVNVKGQADTYTPAPKVQTVDNGAVPEAKNSIGNVDSLPPKTTFEWKGGAPNTAVGQPGEVSGTVIVHYPDGTSEEVPVKVNVKGQADTYTPAPKVQTVDNGAVPEAKNSIGNVDSLPPKTTFEWKGGAPNTAVGQPGEVSGTVIVHYPDGTSEEVPVKVNVKGQADTYTPAPKVQTVDNGAVPEAKNSIGNVDSLPPKTTFEWKGGAPNTAVGQPGEVSGTVIVHYPDGTSEEVPVKVNVKGQADTYTPAPKVQTVDNGAVPEAKNSIGNVDSLPPKTTFEWKGGAPNTAVGQPGEVSGTVIVHYPDGTSEEVPVKVNVKGQADTYTPAPKVQTVDNGAVPEAKNSIGNVDSLPPKTTFEWKGGAPNTAVGQPGEVSGTVIVHYPDGTSEEVPVKLTVRQINAKGTPETQPEAPDFTGGVNTPDAPTNEIPDYTDPIGSTGVDENGNLIVPPIVEAPDFTGGVNAPDAPISEVPEYTDPIGSTGVDGNGNLIIPPSVDIPEFMGGTSTPDAPTHEFSEFNGNIAINGELPEPAQLPKVKLIITKWVDENGNELKPADAKTPKVLGEENEAFEHGEIEGYEFVRTEVDENGEVVTHIFRKVASSGVTQTNDNVKPEQTPDALHVPTNETHAQPEKDEVKQKETQTTLPKTGTANSLGLLSVATSSILFGLGFFILSKKEDEE